MKRVLPIFMAWAMAVTITGCSRNTKSVESTPQAPKSTVIESVIQREEESGELEGGPAKGPGTIEITHELGTVKVPYNPQNIAALDLAALDMLDALGVGERVTGVPKKSSVSYLDSYVEDKNVAHLGSVKEVDMEALYSLQPEVIFIGGRLSEDYDSLSKIAPVVLLSIDRELGYMASFKKNAESIASIFGLEDEAIQRIKGFDTRLAIIEEAAKGKTAITGLVTSGSMSTLGEGSRCSLIIDEAGFENSASDVNSTHGDSASFELLLEKNPDYLFILDRDNAIDSDGGKAAKEVVENEIVMKTDAFRNGRIIYLTPDVWYLSEGGITATDQMIKDLEKGVLGL